MSDGKFTAHPNPAVMGTDVRALKFKDDPFGQRGYVGSLLSPSLIRLRAARLGSVGSRRTASACGPRTIR